MRNRILQVMKSKGMTQQEFSRTTGISPASLSSIFNGRTAPTMKHAEALHRVFPKLNVSWLLFGEGSMFAEVDELESNDSLQEDAVLAEGEMDEKSAALTGGSSALGVSGSELCQMHSYAQPDDGMATRPESFPIHTDLHSGGSRMGRGGSPTYMQNMPINDANSYPHNFPGMMSQVNYSDKKQRKIVEIRIFFDDGTFETFQGNS